MGLVLTPGSTYNIQTHLEVEGVFNIKVIPLDASLCLLEEMDEGFISEMIREGSTWWKQWFKKISMWNASDVDTERVIWI